MGWLRRLVPFFTFALCLTGTLATHAQDAAEAIEIRVMTFNIWLGGELVDFGKVVEAIRASGADVVGLQEATGNTQRLAKELGWQHASERTQIISRYPLIETPESLGEYVYVQAAPGQVIAVANVHLPSDPYGPYAVRDGSALDDVLELERSTRLPALETTLTAVADLIASGVPVLLTGDFNTPSHRDWTERMVNVREGMAYSVEWPVTVAAEAAGFVDTFRSVHPDPLANPGITWTYGYPYPRVKPGEMIDRIDLVFAANTVEIVDSQIVGEAGGPNVDIGIAPFPSDHRGVVSTVRVVPVTPPVFVDAQARAARSGDPLVVRYHAPEGEGVDRIGIVASGSTSSDELLMWLPPYEASFFGAVTFGTGTLQPGAYDAILVSSADEVLSRDAFWVLERDAAPVVGTDKAEYASGETITVTWANVHPMRWDWLAIYSVGDPDLYNNYWAYGYTGARVSGEFTFDVDTIGDALPSGEYVVRLLRDDGYAVLAETTFIVAE